MSLLSNIAAKLNFSAAAADNPSEYLLHKPLMNTAVNFSQHLPTFMQNPFLQVAHEASSTANFVSAPILDTMSQRLGLANSTSALSTAAAKLDVAGLKLTEPRTYTRLAEKAMFNLLHMFSFSHSKMI